MSGPLNHSPAKIVRQLLVTLGLGTLVPDPINGVITYGAWPIYVDFFQTEPDDALGVNNTQSIMGPREALTGDVLEKYGLQFIIRANDPDTARNKGQTILTAIDRGIYRQLVSLTDNVPSTYLVHCLTRKSSLLNLGAEMPTNNRRKLSLNAVAEITMQ